MPQFMSSMPYCAEVLRSVEYRSLNLTHGGIICLDVKMACKGRFKGLLLEKCNKVSPAECKEQEEYSNEDNMWEHSPI